MEALRYNETSVTVYHARPVAHSGTDKDHNFRGRVVCFTPSTAELGSKRTHIARRQTFSVTLVKTVSGLCCSSYRGGVG